MARRMEDPYVGLPPGSLEDKELTVAYQQGDEGAYDTIYDRYAQRVHNVCRRMLANPQDAQDAAQETFLRVHQALGRFNGRYQLGAWITRIATNICLDQIRAKSRRPTTAISLEDDELEDTEASEIDAPDEVVIRRFEGRRVRRVLSSLPPMHRAAIVLRDFEGLSYSEVAVVLGISEAQVKALIHRARQGFKRSWPVIGAEILIPARWFHRVRKVDAPAKEQSTQTMTSVHQLAESVTAVAAPAASSCSVLSHCGSFVAERLAPALAAVAVGAASLAGPVAASNAPKKPAPAPSLAEGELAKTVSSNEVKASAAPSQPQERRTSEPATGTDDKGPTQSQAPTAAPSPAPSAEPSPTPSSAAPAPTEKATGNESSSGSTSPPAPPPSPSPSPSPTPWTATVGFDSGSGLSPREPISNKTMVGCASRKFEQTMVIDVKVGSDLYRGTLQVRASSSGGDVQLVLDKNGREWRYRSWGTPPVATWTVESTSARVRLAGEYGPVHGSDPEKDGLPGAGTFDAQLTLDCSAATVTTESVIFTTR